MKDSTENIIRVIIGMLLYVGFFGYNIYNRAKSIISIMSVVSVARLYKERGVMG